MLSRFNKIVLIIATIVLIVSLLILGYFLNVALLNDSYPPVVSECPDYWDVSGNTCINKTFVNQGNGSSDCTTIETASFLMNGSDKNSVICEKKKKANECNLNWDGITNNSTACDSSYLG